MDIDPSIITRSIEELFHNAPCGYIAATLDGTIVQVNHTLLQLSGQTRESLVGRRFSDLLTLPGRMYYETHFGPLMRMQGFIREVAFDLQRPSSPPLPVIVNAVHQRSADDQPVLTLITIFDATDRRRYEQELLLAKRRAETATESAHAARQLAEQISRVKDEFLATLSHELRTPLSAILGWTEILRRKGGLTPDQQNGLAVIERSARAQATLINDLLDMSRIDSGKLRLDVQTVHLAEVVNAALDTIRPAADAKGVNLYKVLDPSITVSGDPGRLQQVFWNLLINAVKFTPRGGSVRVVMQRVNSHIEVSVRDTGQGMTAEFIRHAFERFRQSDSSQTQKTTGLGLGLSIVKTLVEMHGGAVDVHSDGPGAGSTLTVSLPVAVAHPAGSGERVHPRAAASNVAPAIDGISLHGINVVVVDDEPDARTMLCKILTTSGANVQSAASASEGLALIEAFTPHVLVSDIGMPGEDGYEFIRRVRMLGGDISRVRAIALTAFARLEDRTRAMLAGFHVHLAKPVDAHELIVAVATLAGR